MSQENINKDDSDLPAKTEGEKELLNKQPMQ
jgi:hypothetical protein